MPGPVRRASATVGVKEASSGARGCDGGGDGSDDRGEGKGTDPGGRLSGGN